MNFSNTLAIAIIIGLASAAYGYFSTKKKKPLRTPRKMEIHDVIMFSQAKEPELIRSQFSRNLVNPSMDRLLSYLNLTRHSLDICMYMITNCDIAHLIHKLHSRGVKIRCIVDADMAYCTGSATKGIEKQGIELRWMKSTNLMHHKFCIIDANYDSIDSDVIPFVMTGSLNWTTQGLNGNWEDVLVTSKPIIVHQLHMEFEKLWTQFKAIDK